MTLNRLTLVLALAAVFAAPALQAQTPPTATSAAALQSKEGWFRALADFDFMRANVDIPPKKGVMLIDSRPAARQFDPGHISGAVGWEITVTVLSPESTVSAEAKADGRYRVEGLAPGPVEVSWVAEAAQTSTDGVSLGGQRIGRTQITLDAGGNRYDISL